MKIISIETLNVNTNVKLLYNPNVALIVYLCEEEMAIMKKI